jgi:hypothetical protein
MQSRCDPAESQMILSMPFTPLLGFLSLFYKLEVLDTVMSVNASGEQIIFYTPLYF